MTVCVRCYFHKIGTANYIYIYIYIQRESNSLPTFLKMSGRGVAQKLSHPDRG